MPSPRTARPHRSLGRTLAAVGIAVAGFALYGMTTGRLAGGILSHRQGDKLWQFVCLVPAVGALAVLVGNHLRFDAARILGSNAGRLKPWIVSTGFCLLMAVAAFPLERLPGSRDEVEYLFQGRALATGMLTAPPPPCTDSFSMRGMVVWNDRWITPYEPGHPLLLGMADRIGMAWMVGPILGALSLWLVMLLAREIQGSGAAASAAALGTLSPFFIFLAACHSYHVTSLALSAFVLLALAKAHRSETRAAWEWGMGVAGGLLLLVRPLTVGILVLPVLLVEVHDWRHGKAPWRRWGRMLIAALPFVVLLVLYNSVVTGHPMRTARQCVYPTSLFGFGDAASHGPSYGSVGHSPLKGMMNLFRQLGTLSTGLFGWPLISLLPAVVGFWSTRRSIWSWAFASMMAVTGGILFFSWYSAVEHGPRHYLDAWPGLMILSAVGIGSAIGTMRNRLGRVGSNTAIVAVCGLFLLSFVRYVPLRVRDVTNRHLGVDPRVHEVVRAAVEPPAVVFIQCPTEPADYYASGFVHNDPRLRRPIIYARHISPEADRACLRRLPGRAGYLLRYDPHSPIVAPSTLASP